jgi:hypothetical protein
MPRRREAEAKGCQTGAHFEDDAPRKRAVPETTARFSLDRQRERGRDTARVGWYAACTHARFVTLVDVAIILSGIILAAWLFDGQSS